jgi:hypothetical protein
MKGLLSLLMVVVVASPLMAAVQTVGVWNFNDGTTNDTSGIGVAADGILANGAAIVADPLGGRGNVLYIPGGTGIMNTPAASESKFDSTTYTKISFWAYTPFTDNDWWTMTIGKGYAGASRTFVDASGTSDYVFNYCDMVRADNSIFNLSGAAWENPQAKTSGWHFYETAVFPNMVDGVPGWEAAVWIDGVKGLYPATTQAALETAIGLRLTDDTVQIGGGGWMGYIDDVTYSVEPIPEPCTIALLGLGALALRRKK